MREQEQEQLWSTPDGRVRRESGPRTTSRMAAVVAATPTRAGKSTPQTLASPARASTTPARATLQGAKRVAITAQGYSVTCPDLAKAEFVSWEVLHSYLDLYQKETFQVLRTRSTKSVAERNMQIKNAQNSSAEVIPDEWEVYAKTIICTHGGKYRCRGKGKRPRQEVRLMGCTTQINACVQGVSEPPVKFAVCVTKTALTHNHKLGLRAYKHYLANRMSIREVGGACGAVSGAVRGAIGRVGGSVGGFKYAY
ncbi:hypothetical protein GQ600_20367 [Phytophthora cactorum]|nr:hypothetical protein GQ600_20367 [Phytophthora cactorum]